MVKKLAFRFFTPVIVLAFSCVLLAASPRDDQSKTAMDKAYMAKCGQCHGEKGKGDGSAAALLDPRPRDFTSGKYKFRSTESGSIPTDEDLAATIQNGLHGTAMPDWKPFLKGDTLKAVVVYIKAFSPRFAKEKPKPIKVGTPVPSSAGSIAEGKRVYEKLQCGKCHGFDGAGAGAIAADLKDEWGYNIVPTNLTEPWTFRGGATAKYVLLRFQTGIDGTPMPSYNGSATETEMWNLANYVVSLARKPVWTMNEQELKSFYAAHDAKNKQHPVQRGKYLVEVLGCAYCHSPIREDGSIVEELKYAGGQRWQLVPFGNFVSYNLTSEKETGLSNWTDDQIKKFLTTGTRRDGSRMYPFPMPWAAYAGLKPEDLNAIVSYLRTIPPVYNKIPDPQSSNIFSYMWGKFKMLILKKDLPFFTYPGNAGTTKEKSMGAVVMTKEGRP